MAREFSFVLSLQMGIGGYRAFLPIRPADKAAVV